MITSMPLAGIGSQIGVDVGMGMGISGADRELDGRVLCFGEFVECLLRCALQLRVDTDSPYPTDGTLIEALFYVMDKRAAMFRKKKRTRERSRSTAVKEARARAKEQAKAKAKEAQAKAKAKKG